MENGDFPQHYDLQIPGSASHGHAADDVKVADIAGALNPDYHSYGRQEESKAVRRSYYEATGMLANANQIAANAEMYMPIKALN